MSTQTHSSPKPSKAEQLDLFSEHPEQAASQGKRSPSGGQSPRRRHKGTDGAPLLPEQEFAAALAPAEEAQSVLGPSEAATGARCEQPPKLEVEHSNVADLEIATGGAVKPDIRLNYPQHLGAVMKAIKMDQELTKRQRADLQSALRGLSQLSGKELALIPTAPDELRKLFASILPVAHGITAGRWGHIRSRVTRAIRQAGAPVMPGRFTSKITFAWKQLAEALPKGGKIGLSKFMRYCTDRNLEPADVTQAVFDAFLEILQTQSLIRSPAHSHRVACDQWNIGAASVKGWPAFTVAVPENTRCYALEWSAFPESLRQDVDAYFTRSANPDPFDEIPLRPLRPSTIQHQRKQIREVASLLVHSGVPIEEVKYLSTLVAPDTAKRLLKEAQKRLGDKSRYLSALAQLLATVAKHWCRSSDDVVKKLRGYAAGTKPKSEGMTPKNKERLRQFDDPDNVLKLLTLPRKTFKALNARKELGHDAARQAMYALAVAILINLPLRTQNLIALDCSRHIVPVGHKRRRTWHLVVPSHEIKNEEAIEAVVPEDVVERMEIYRKRYLPLICQTPTNLLFPNEEGKLRYPSSFTDAVCTFIKRETGLIMNAHLFRHLAVTTYLQRHPEDLETARRILGHKHISTTMRYYARLKMTDAFRRYNAMIAEMRTESGVRPRQTNRKIKGGR